MNHIGVLVLAVAVFLPGCSKTRDAGDAPERSAEREGREPKVAKTAAPDPNATARAETDEYIVEVRKAADLSAGMDTRIEVVVIPKGEFHFNLEFPSRIAISAPSGVTVDKATQSLSDARAKDETNGASWDVTMTVSEAGEKEFRCDLKFLVCTDVLCDPQTASLSWRVDVL